MLTIFAWTYLSPSVFFGESDYRSFAHFKLICLLSYCWFLRVLYSGHRSFIRSVSANIFPQSVCCPFMLPSVSFLEKSSKFYAVFLCWVVLWVSFLRNLCPVQGLRFSPMFSSKVLVFHFTFESYDPFELLFHTVWDLGQCLFLWACGVQIPRNAELPKCSNDPFSIELPLHFVKKSISRIYVGLYLILHSVPTDLCFIPLTVFLAITFFDYCYFIVRKSATMSPPTFFYKLLLLF